MDTNIVNAFVLRAVVLIVTLAKRGWTDEPETRLTRWDGRIDWRLWFGKPSRH